jgi:hypothetical protein
VAGGVLADPVLTGVHQRRDLGNVSLAAGIREGGDLRGPRPAWQGDRRTEAVAQAGIDDGRDVAGSGQVPFCDRFGQDAGGVQASQFCAAQGAP